MIKHPAPPAPGERISVIGGAGFIGTRLCHRLARSGQDFEIIDLHPSRSFPEHSKIADITRIDSLRAALTGSVIVHLAAAHTDDLPGDAPYFRTNVEGTRNICRCAAEIGVRKIIFTSSVAVYGFAPEGTDETGALAPFHAYGRSKRDAEDVLRHWRVDAPSRALVIMRPTVVFGEGNRGNVHRLLQQIARRRFVMIGAGTNRKSMAYVGNVAACLEHVIHAPISDGLLNYVDGPDYDMRSLVAETRALIGHPARMPFALPYPVGLTLGLAADAVSRLSGRNISISALRVRKFCATTSFAADPGRQHGFTPPYSIAEGLRRTLQAEFLEPDPAREVFFTE